MDGQGKEREYHVQWQEFFTGHVVGKKNSKVTAHISEEDFTARINTDEKEYNIEAPSIKGKPKHSEEGLPPDFRIYKCIIPVVFLNII
ncbi:UNVERIFIED_CONTAM: Disintegrin and metalloproteinase domain-containing protein 17, partial [Gekko kuhli]